MARMGQDMKADQTEPPADTTRDLGNRIRVSMDFLCENSTNLQEVLVYFLSRGVLKQRETEVIEKKDSTYDSFRQLFTILIPKVGSGDNKQHFYDAFKQSGNEHILTELDVFNLR